eukprot:2576280-Pyramimonas_sp.AAC.2
MAGRLGSGTGGSLVRNRLGSPIRGPRLSGNRSSAHRPGLGFPPLKGLGARASCLSSPACRPPVGPSPHAYYAYFYYAYAYHQVNRMLAVALNTKKLKDKLMDTSQLINEVNIEYARTMNKIIFDDSMQHPQVYSLHDARAIGSCPGYILFRCARLARASGIFPPRRARDWLVPRVYSLRAPSGR